MDYPGNNRCFSCTLEKLGYCRNDCLLYISLLLRYNDYYYFIILILIILLLLIIIIIVIYYYTWRQYCVCVCVCSFVCLFGWIALLNIYISLRYVCILWYEIHAILVNHTFPFSIFSFFLSIEIYIFTNLRYFPFFPAIWN